MKTVIYSLIIAIVFCSLWLFADKAHTSSDANPFGVSDTLTSSCR
jgi:hypothetical protein